MGLALFVEMACQTGGRGRRADLSQSRKVSALHGGRPGCLGRISYRRPAPVDFGCDIAVDMASQRHNPRRAKTLLCYSIGEAAELYQVHPQTVRNWKKQGLKPIDGARPELYHGSALNHFHASQRCARKQVCAPGEIYCFGCRVPRSPALGMAEYVPLTATTGSISAICPDCHRMMTQRVNATRLAVFRTKVEVTVRLDDERLAESR